jgi:hypothetical protein
LIIRIISIGAGLKKIWDGDFLNTVFLFEDRSIHFSVEELGTSYIAGGI